MTNAFRILILAFALLNAANASADFDAATAARIQAAIAGDHRSAENKARDQYRKPSETLEFLGLRSDMTVVEIWPGAGWYTEILAPALQEDGKFYAAQFSPNAPFGYQRRAFGTFLTTLGNTPDLFRDVTITAFELPYDLRIAPPGSADMVLTFRNAHNWVMEINAGGAYAHAAFKAAFDALKTGGVFGVVDHEWDDPKTEDPLAANGYISKQRTIELAKAAGFELAAESDLLHNAKDTKDYERGVWTLPPSYALGDKDRKRYEAIGESDRFLLKFVKP